MATKDFNTRAASQIGPITRFDPVTPDDDADLRLGATRGVYVGAPGVVVVMDSHGTIVNLASGAGQYHPISVVRIMANGTSASDIVALY